MIIFSSLNRLSDHLNRLLKKRLWLQVIIALVLGITLGVFLNPEFGWIDGRAAKTASEWLNLPGSIFMRLVQMVMIPLIFTSIITGIVSNNTDDLKKFGLKLILYFLVTTTVAIIIGMVLSNILAPGEFVRELGGLTASGEIQMESAAVERASVAATISNLIPNNPLSAMMTGEMLGVVIFTIIIGIAITQLKPEHANPLIRVSEAIQKICMIIVSWAMMLVPYAVLGLMAALVINIGHEVLLGLAYYIGVVILGLLILLVFYLLILFFFTRTKPGYFLTRVKDPLLLAFSTASSAAVMPVTMKTADEKLGVNSKVSDFVVPVGATINMDGTALFQCATAIFLAQAYGIELSIMAMILLVITIVGASVGTPSIPGGGVLVMASVLGGIGIPVEGLVVIIGIDRILGMFRTTLNVTGDLVACMVFNKWFGSTENSRPAQNVLN